jgi:hypothetical protein
MKQIDNLGDFAKHFAKQEGSFRLFRCFNTSFHLNLLMGLVCMTAVEGVEETDRVWRTDIVESTGP